MRFLMAFLCVAFLCSVADAAPRCRGGRCNVQPQVAVTQTTTVQVGGDFGAAAHAAYLASVRQLIHAASPTGIEVICAGCNEQTAIVMWRNSPAHAALLPRVRVIRCVNGYCVGR